MLLQFTVENYLSFDEPTTFSMRAGADKDLPGHVLGAKHQAVKGAAIYGANAAGKSNLILAMGFARDLIVKGRSSAQGIPVRPFGLGSAKRPSGFHWQFVHEGKVWSYGFDVTSRRIVAEYLFARDENGGTEKKYFERTTDESGQVEVKFGPALRGPAKGKLAQRLDLIVENLRAEQPFLTHAMENRVYELLAAWKWFNEGVHILRAEKTVRNLNLTSDESRGFLEFISELLRFADTGIDCLVAERKPLDEDGPAANFDEEDLNLIENVFHDSESRCLYNFDNDSVPHGIMCDDNGEFWSIHFKARHLGNNGEFENFPLEWESDGTRRLIQLASTLFLLRFDSFVFAIDELDRRLHTLLVQEFVKIALGDASKGQLIFTTHDTNLLDGQQLRRDEIHFVQKDEGHSILSRLSDWGVRKDLDYEKAYLRGSFEGRPFFGFAPSLQGLDVVGEAAPPTEAELRAQLSEAA